MVIIGHTTWPVIILPNLVLVIIRILQQPHSCYQNVYGRLLVHVIYSTCSYDNKIYCYVQL